MNSITITHNNEPIELIPQVKNVTNKKKKFISRFEFRTSVEDGLVRDGIRIGNHLKVINKISIYGIDNLDLEFVSDDGSLLNVQVRYSLIMMQKKMLQVLLDAGYRYELISGKSIVEDYLANYSMYTEGYSPDSNKVSAVQTGWHDHDYVLPNETIAATEPLYKFFPSEESDSFGLVGAIKQSGTLQEWQDNVAIECIGHELLELGIYAAFCGPLVRFCGATFGLHFFGQSSIGKSTIMEAGASVYGEPKLYMNVWDATAPGMELKAYNSNHTLLILDELNRATPQSFRSIYQIVDGKGRAKKTEVSRRWQTVLISSGEVSTEIYAKQKKVALKAGELVRLVNIESVKITTDQDHSNRIKKNAAKYHGTAIIEYVKQLQNEFGANIEVKLREQYNAKLETFKALLEKNKIENPQAYRVAEYFALCIMAGELAKKYKILQSGFEPVKTNLKIFKRWLDDNGRTAEEKMICKYFLSAVNEPRTFINILEHSKLGASGIGYYRIIGDSKKFWLIPAKVEPLVFHGYLKLDPNLCWKTLMKFGAIPQKPEQVAVGSGHWWLYPLDVSKLK